MRSKLVVRYMDGRVVKGWSPDLFPNKPTFHVTDWETNETIEVQLSELKGVFFVKDYTSGPDRHRRYDLERAGLGRRVRVRFSDGEVIEGYTNGYSGDRLAFFVFPPDPEDNTERMLVVTKATTEVKLV
ncbi:MAG TPA: hypothetical protein VHR17_09865 [Thermoanaerobaculia bacterium]|nr:hypothetical protein [Thermoanaerobaculia bacterium]